MLVIAPNQIGAKSGGSCVPTVSGHWPSPDANTRDRLTLTEPYPNKDLRTSDNLCNVMIRCSGRFDILPFLP